jgi:hypothetical protein
MFKMNFTNKQNPMFGNGSISPFRITRPTEQGGVIKTKVIETPKHIPLNGSLLDRVYTRPKGGGCGCGK